MLSKQLDQFYTKKHIAEKCYNLVSKIISIDDYFLMEPSAGEGSFSDLFHSNSVVFDIDPKKSTIIKQDFLEFDSTNLNKQKIAVIGNPPFGKNSSLAIKFFNKAATFANCIAFIVPKSFKKDSFTNKLNLEFHLIQEIELEKNSFVFNAKDYHVPCVFQIWERKTIRRNKIDQRNKTEYFEFCDKELADIAIRRVGRLAGKVIEDFENYKKPSHYYIKVTHNNPIDIINGLKLCYPEFNKMANNTSGSPSLSKHELITCFETLYN